VPTELTSGAAAPRRGATWTVVAGHQVRRADDRAGLSAWNSVDAAGLLDDVAPELSHPTMGLHRVASGSARIRKTTVVFQALLVAAMVIAVAVIILGPASTAAPDAGSPDTAPPPVFVFPAD